MNGVFNEEVLKGEIERVWGESGAHAEVFRDLMKRAKQNEKQIAFIKKLNEWLDSEIKDKENISATTLISPSQLFNMVKIKIRTLMT